MNNRTVSFIEILESRIAPAAAVFDLSSLDGTNGFKLSGIANFDEVGISVSDAGDVNGDGFDDVVVAASRGPTSYVVFGKREGFAASSSLSLLDGPNGFAIDAPGSSSLIASAAGDVNGDGFADVIIGAPNANGGSLYAGESYVVFGKAGGFASRMNVASLNGTNGFKVSGTTFSQRAGSAVGAAGDFNHDGFDDLIIGASDAYTNGARSGAAYVVFGKASGFPADLSLAALNGTNGFRLEGTAAEAKTGGSVSGAGDVNGDGFDDVIVGALGASPVNYGCGASYVVFGRASGFAPSTNLSSLNGTNGFRIDGVATLDRSGSSVSAAGDVNGDGFSDVIIGAYQADSNGVDSGASYVVFGKADGFAANLDLATLNGLNGFRLDGPPGSRAGLPSSSAGDFNGDGFDDVLVESADLTFNPNYLIFGKATGFAASLNLSALTGSEGFKIDGAPRSVSRALSNAGDVNGDGFDDVIIGADRADKRGAAYVIFGSAEGPLPEVRISDVTLKEPAAGSVTASFTISLSSVSSDTVTVQFASADDSAIAPNDYTPIPPSTLIFSPGETNKTVLVSVNADSRSEVGETFFINVSTPSNAIVRDAQGVGTILDKITDFQLSSLDGRNGFTMNGAAPTDRFGMSVSDAGDVNGDGFADVIIGADGVDANGINSGAGYVVFGGATGFPATLNLATLDGKNGFRLAGGASADYAGRSVSAAGDVNGDGFGDVIVGAYGVDRNGQRSGVSYVVFGKASAFPETLNLAELNGTNGFKLNGAAISELSGWSVSGAGDVNDDGFDDVIIGAPGLTPSGNLAGAGGAYVVFGKAGGFTPELNLSSLNGSNGFKLTGVAAQDRSGHSVSGAGDVNGDGFDDIIIGAYAAAPHGERSGASYVVFGNASGFSDTLSLASLNGNNGFKLNGVAPYDFAGHAVGAAGDINGDGFADVVVGADGAADGTDRSGASYVIFGKRSGFMATMELASLDGRNGFKLRGVGASDQSGVSVSKAGDFNGDGVDDMIVGAFGTPLNGISSGASYVIFGHASEFPAEVNLSTLVGRTGFKLYGITTGDAAGRSVSAAGDVNRDGFDDVIIGAPSADRGSSDAGSSYVVFGKGVEVSVADAAVVEGDADNSQLQFTVSLSEEGLLPVTVDLMTMNGTAFAASDFVSLENTKLTFAPGEISKTIAINVIGDRLFENDETFFVRLANPTRGVLREDVGTATIHNDDAPPAVTIMASSLLEGDVGTGAMDFIVRLSEVSGLPATFDFASIDGTALAGADYVSLTPATLTFEAGETSKTIRVAITGDTEIEDHEEFAIVLSNPGNATLANALASGTIFNDDTAVGISDLSADEHDSARSTFDFVISLAKPSALPVTVNFQTMSGTAESDSDFISSASSVTFLPGEIVHTLSIDVIGDTNIEADEKFSVLITNATNGTIFDDTGIGTILNDDALLSIDNGSILEGHAGTRAVTLTVTLASATVLPVTVSIAPGEGTAAPDVDYVSVSPATIVFAPGETSKTVAIDVRGDTEVEPSEIFSVVLSSPVNSLIDPDHDVGTVTILDDDVMLMGPRKATFTDSDGERITIKVSKGSLKVENFTIVPLGIGSQLALIDFSGQSQFTGAHIGIKAKAATGVTAGNRMTAVEYINATGVDLGNLSVQGVLGRINAGDELTRKPGLASLAAYAMGHSELLSQSKNVALESNIAGSIKSLKLAGPFADTIFTASGDIGSVAIHGGISGGVLRSNGRIGSIAITGDLAASPTNPAAISVRGNLAPASKAQAIALGSLSISGSISHAEILAGFDSAGTVVNPDAAIGRINIGKDWVASSVAAGVARGEDGMWGTGDDQLAAGKNPIIASIAAVVIKGNVTGTESETDHFGFVAEQIFAFKSGGTLFPLAPGARNDLAGFEIGTNADVTIREVAQGIRG